MGEDREDRTVNNKEGLLDIIDSWAENFEGKLNRRGEEERMQERER